MKPMPVPHQLAAAALIAAALAAACTAATTQPTASPSTSASTATADASPSVTGDGVNDAYSCDADAHASCAGFYATDWQAYARANGYTTASWKYGLLDCLGKHTLSSSCRASLDRRAALNAQMMTACGSYCKGTTPQPGAEPCVDRLKAIYASLDTACRVALDAHEAAKPIVRSALP